MIKYVYFVSFVINLIIFAAIILEITEKYKWN